jgi:hypothetical protein
VAIRAERDCEWRHVERALALAAGAGLWRVMFSAEDPAFAGARPAWRGGDGGPRD